MNMYKLRRKRGIKSYIPASPTIPASPGNPGAPASPVSPFGPKIT